MDSNDQDIQSLNKQLTMARENAILGDYDLALAQFKKIFSDISGYSKKYGAAPSAGQGSYSKKPVNNQTDYYLQEKWNQFKKDLKSEYDMIVHMH